MMPPPLDEGARLASLRRARLLDTPPDLELDELVTLAAEITGWPIAWISLVDEGRVWLKSATGFAPAELPRAGSFCEAALTARELFEVPDARVDPRFAEATARELLAYAGAPIALADGQRIGVLAVLDARPHLLSKEARRALPVLARQVAAQITLRAQRLDDERPQSSRGGLRGAIAGLGSESMLYRAVVDALSEGVVVQGRDGRIVASNESAQRILGVPHEELLGRSSMDARGEAATGDAPPALITLATGEPQRGALRTVRRADGEATWISINTHPLRDADDRVIGVVSSFFDVTAFKRAEAALRESEARYRSIVDHSIDAIILAVTEGAVLAANRAASETFGYRTDELVGLPCAALVDPEDTLGAAALADRSRAGRFRGEIRMRKKDGAPFTAEVSLAVFGDREGRRVTVAIVRDITDRQQIDRMKSEFVSVVSHELRTPMTSIRAALALLDGGVLGPLSDAATEAVAIARADAERLSRLVDDVLDLSKIEAGHLSLRLAGVDLARVVAAAIDSSREEARAAGVELWSEVAPVATVRADADRITQVIVNLLSNAVKFAPRGSVVRVEVAPSGAAAARVAVIDQGPGIAAEHVDKLFRRFQQLDGSDTRSKGGTGLGLSICKGIVDQHRGRIGVDSEVGRGSTFWFELPL